MSELTLLAINPGSTSTKIGAFTVRGGHADCIFSEEMQHEKATIQSYPSTMAQKDFRLDAVQNALAKHNASDMKFDAIVGRGGLLQAMPGGAYAVDAAMLDDLSVAKYGEHPCNLGAIIANELAQTRGIKAYIVDPVVTDEMMEVARYTGLPEIKRRSVFHALSQRASARYAAEQMNVDYEDSRFIVAHMGGGISIGAHCKGKVVDVINALDGEGPFSPERTGKLPLIPILFMLESGTETTGTLRTKILREGGLYAHAGTNDLRDVQRMADGGDRHADEIIQAMAYQISREIASMAPALMDKPKAKMNAVVLTGGLARSERLTSLIEARTSFLAPTVIITDVEELRAMAEGVGRMLARQ